MPPPAAHCPRAAAWMYAAQLTRRPAVACRRPRSRDSPSCLGSRRDYHGWTPRAGGDLMDRAPSSGRGPAWWRDPLLATASVLLLAAIVFAAWAGWSWLSAPRASAAAQSRDHALRAGEQDILNFNTLDYRTVAQGLRLWEQSSTGALHAQIMAGQASFEQQIKQAQTVTTARILDGALTEMNTRAGTA